MTINKSMSKSFYNCCIVFCWKLINTKICYRNKFGFNVEFKMFHMRYSIVFVESENDKMSERKRRYDKMTLSSHPLSLNTSYNAIVLHVNKRILSILFSPPVNIIVMTVWCPILIICHIYMILKVSIKKQVLRHHWQDPRWTACSCYLRFTT